MSGPPRIEWRPLHQVLPAAHNPKRHAGRLIRNSISRFGMVETMVIDGRTDRLVAGHGRLEELKHLHELDPDSPPTHVRLTDDGTWLVPVRADWASRDDTHAATYVIASNQLSIAGGRDNDLTLQALELLRDAGADLLEVAGFTEADLDRLLAGPEPEPEPIMKKQMDAAVLITCRDEDEQEQTFNNLTGQGYTVKVVST